MSAQPSAPEKPSDEAAAPDEPAETGKPADPEGRLLDKWSESIIGPQGVEAVASFEKGNASPDEVMATIALRASVVLGYASPDELDVAQPLGELGFDSLMAVQVRNALISDGLDLPLYLLNGGPSVVELAAYAMRQLRDELGEDVEESRIPAAVFASHAAAFVAGMVTAVCLLLLLVNLFPNLLG